MKEEAAGVIVRKEDRKTEDGFTRLIPFLTFLIAPFLSIGRASVVGKGKRRGRRRRTTLRKRSYLSRIVRTCTVDTTVVL